MTSATRLKLSGPLAVALSLPLLPGGITVEKVQTFRYHGHLITVERNNGQCTLGISPFDKNRPNEGSGAALVDLENDVAQLVRACPDIDPKNVKIRWAPGVYSWPLPSKPYEMLRQ